MINHPTPLLLETRCGQWIAFADANTFRARVPSYFYRHFGPHFRPVPHDPLARVFCVPRHLHLGEITLTAAGICARLRDGHGRIRDPRTLPGAQRIVTRRPSRRRRRANTGGYRNVRHSARQELRADAATRDQAGALGLGRDALVRARRAAYVRHTLDDFDAPLRGERSGWKNNRRQQYRARPHSPGA
ncbi:hypothetical protein J2T57_001547 [Natronocella acetinitrilica]|uniref:Uncharacterized protein n=1 Tax=Natronocella acetinitrilica TaxID=414046 RepID=A0AAE3G2C5_9GAMM|nr:hypothetical protein [Natronocella acetinitrilica]MCP1674445.1 hypothetical protein [Natronocella acetinitrilica]